MRNTSHIGEISRTQVIAALTLQGKMILLPMGDHQRYDLAIDEAGKFSRVQCKTGKLINGTVAFWACSVDSRSKKGHCLRKSYRQDIEFFGVYCPDNHKVYMVPVADATSTQTCLRIDPPRNGQQAGIRWAKNYEVSRAGSGI